MNIWRRLITGQLKCRELPKELDLSDIREDMERLWQATTQDGRERGACIVLDERLKFAHEVIGTLRSVQPIHRVGDYDDHLGFFHTHPLDLDDGTEVAGFSYQDFTGALEDSDRLSVVRSGNRVLALARTERTRPSAPANGPKEDEFFAVLQHYLDKNLLSYEALRRTNHHLCHKLGFAFYAGKFGHPLRRELIPTLRGKLMSFLRKTLILSLRKEVIP